MTQYENVHTTYKCRYIQTADVENMYMYVHDIVHYGNHPSNNACFCKD